MATYQELIAQKEALARQQAELERLIADTRKAERAGVINQIKQMMEDHGITVADLASRAGRVGRPPKAADGETPAPRKVAPKYRDPATGDTWSGRGLKPKWLAAALESGRNLEEFKV